MFPLLFLLSFFSVTMLSACVSGHRRPYSGLTESVRDLTPLYQQINRSVSSNSSLSAEVIGIVRTGAAEESFPLLVVRYCGKEEVGMHVLVCGGMHGSEPAGALAAVELVRVLSQQPERYAGIAIDIIPIANPWGLSRGVRYNREGKDINRDFSRLESEEARMIHAWLGDRQYDLVLDLHEDVRATGVYLYQFAGDREAFCRSVLSAINGRGYPLEENVRVITLKTENGLIDAPLWGLYYMRFTDQMSLVNHCRLQNSDHVFTMETPTRLSLEERVAIHGLALEMFLQMGWHDDSDASTIH